MKAKVAANQSPWVGSYNYLTAVGEAQTNWYWAPVVQIIRGQAAAITPAVKMMHWPSIASRCGGASLAIPTSPRKPFKAATRGRAR